jgi:hypothetical protein
VQDLDCSVGCNHRVVREKPRIWSGPSLGIEREISDLARKVTREERHRVAIPCQKTKKQDGVELTTGPDRSIPGI